MPNFKLDPLVTQYAKAMLFVVAYALLGAGIIFIPADRDESKVSPAVVHNKAASSVPPWVTLIAKRVLLPYHPPPPPPPASICLLVSIANV